jgi:hypothetical protein
MEWHPQGRPFLVRSGAWKLNGYERWKIGIFLRLNVWHKEERPDKSPAAQADYEIAR